MDYHKKHNTNPQTKEDMEKELDKLSRTLRINRFGLYL